MRRALLYPWTLTRSHLKFGLTLAGLEAVLSKIPADALQQASAYGGRSFDCLNGHVITLLAEAAAITGMQDRQLSICEQLRQQGSPDVGAANVFLSWWLGMSLESLVSGIRTWLATKRRDPATHYFWISTFSIRQVGK